MQKKAKSQFTEFYGVSRYFDRKSAEEKRIFTSLKQERFDFFGLTPTNASDVGIYHHLIVDIMEEMYKTCPVCLHSEFCQLGLWPCVLPALL
jgi:hypothetical protein